MSETYEPGAHWNTVEAVMTRQRAIREFSDQPVDDSILERCIRAATFAPSGNNTQPWRFIVIRDRETKQKLGVVFDELGQQLYGANAPVRTPWEDVPVLIAVVCESAKAMGGASVYPVIQNLLLALHASGLGSVLTTRWKAREAEVKPLLGLPEGTEAFAILPVGWPARRYGRGKRQPVAEVAFREQYGKAW